MEIQDVIPIAATFAKAESNDADLVTL